MSQLKFKVDANTNPAESKMKNLGSSIKAFGKAGAIAVAGVGVAVGKLGYDAINLASDYGEAQSVIDDAFKTMSGSVKAWADSNSVKYGMNKAEMTDMIGLYGTMGKSMGLNEKQNAKIAKDVVKRTADVGAQFNKSNEEVGTAMKGIFTGEGESLKGLGVIMNATTLQRYAQEHSIKKSMKAMSQAELINLRYGFVMEKTNQAQNNFNKTLATSYPGQVKQLGALMDNLKITIGQHLVPYAIKIAQWLGRTVIQAQAWLQKHKEVEQGFKNTFTWMKKHQQSLKIIVGTIVAIKGATLAWNTAMMVVKAGMVAFNFVANLNPIGAIVLAVGLLVAGIKLATAKSGAFKHIWDVIKSVIHAIGDVMGGLMSGAKWIYNKVTGGGGAKKHASGGSIGNSGGMHVYGEAGPEFMVNGGEGQILNMHELKTALGNVGGSTNVILDGEAIGRSISHKVMKNGTTDLYYG